MCFLAHVVIVCYYADLLCQSIMNNAMFWVNAVKTLRCPIVCPNVWYSAYYQLSVRSRLLAPSVSMPFLPLFVFVDM